MTRKKLFIGSKHNFRFFLAFLVLGNNILGSNGDTEFCLKSGSDAIYWVNGTNCPGGILFAEPVNVDCIATTDTAQMEADVCKSTPVDPATSPIQIQFIPKIDGAEIDELNSCNVEAKCGVKGYMEDHWVDKVKTPVLPRKDDPWPDLSSATVKNANPVYNQTQRLFKHLMGLTEDVDGPSLRIITMLKKSFQILGKFCDSRFVPVAFGEDILDAFLFLLAESETSKIMDVPIDDYRRIDKALNDCLDQKTPFEFTGSGCKTRSFIESITTKKGPVSYIPDEFSWKADKHDIIVDSAWSTLSFVHGLCYGTFKDHVNSHHLFEQAVERIFTPEILFRWDKPTILARQDAWDNFFSANVRSSIGNLEFCIKAAYYDAPFLHRLERMLLKYVPSSSSSSSSSTVVTTPAPSGRKKRSTFPLPDYSDLSFYCLSDENHQKDVLDMYKKAVC